MRMPAPGLLGSCNCIRTLFRGSLSGFGHVAGDSEILGNIDDQLEAPQRWRVMQGGRFGTEFCSLRRPAGLVVEASRASLGKCRVAWSAYPGCLPKSSAQKFMLA